MESYDIFKKDETGIYFWIGSAPDWKAANLRADRISNRLPGQYRIVDLMTGDKVEIDTRNLRPLRLVNEAA